MWFSTELQVCKCVALYIYILKRMQLYISNDTRSVDRHCSYNTRTNTIRTFDSDYLLVIR